MKIEFDINEKYQENKIIIVKCKGCKYHKPIDYCEKHNDSGWYDDDFCSFGKKKE